MNIIRQLFSTGKLLATTPNIFSVLQIEPVKNKITLKNNTISSLGEITGSELIIIKHDNPLLAIIKENNESFF